MDEAHQEGGGTVVEDDARVCPFEGLGGTHQESRGAVVKDDGCVGPFEEGPGQAVPERS